LSGRSDKVIAVNMAPGEMQFARMRLSAVSAAQSRVSCTTPPLVASYALCPAHPIKASIDAMLIMEPVRRMGCG
jgi:hypothetical protein